MEVWELSEGLYRSCSAIAAAFRDREAAKGANPKLLNVRMALNT